MHIIYFFTYGYSLKTWKDSGQLDREIKHFEALHEKNNNLTFTLITYGDYEEINYLDKEFINVVPFYRYKNNSKWKFIRFINSFSVIALFNNYDFNDSQLIIQNQLLGSWVAYIFKIKLKIPIIVRTGYDMYEFSILEKKSLFKRIFYKYLTLFALNISNLYTVTSSCDKNFLVKKFSNKYNSKIKIRPNWASENNEFVNTNNILRDTKKIISIGRLENQKNYEFIIRSLYKTNFELDIYGEGTLKKSLAELAESLQVKVNFCGIVDNEKLLNLLRSYKYFITSSKFEGNPKSVLEAMASGCIVLASKIKNHVEFLNNQNSILFDNDINQLNNIFLNLNNTNYQNLIMNAYKTIESGYTLESLVLNEINDFNMLLVK